jgi:hypothetical protein
MNAPGFAIVGAGWSVTILAASEDAREMLDRYLLPWLPRAAPDEGPGNEVFRVTCVGEGFELHGAEGRLASCSTMEGMVPLLQGFIDASVVRRLTGTAAVHAGAVAFDGAAVLFPGVSRSGKSTLVAELLARGLTYFSDEYALIDSEGLVHPYPRALMLREGRPDARPVLAEGAQGREAAPVALILALEFAPGASWDVRRVPQSEMLVTLLKNTPHTLEETKNLVPRLLRASAGAACYAGVRGEAADTVGHILELLAGSR